MDTICSIIVTTLNLGHMQPGRELKEWIPLGYDLYCIGLQESDFEPRPPFKSFDEEWFNIVNNHLGSDYKTLAQISHSHVTLSIHIKNSLQNHIKNAISSFHHITETKGGVGIGVWIENISICFICAHLAAHQFAYQERNLSMCTIENGLLFSGKAVKEFDHIFVSGDLNYRVVGIPWEESLKMITAKEYSKMLEKDQLNQERASNNVLIGYCEGAIHFPPTFKFHTNLSNEYSPKTADPIGLAFPSWCDRILWKTNTTRSVIQQKVYTNAPTITYSDHRPVLAVFTLLGNNL